MVEKFDRDERQLYPLDKPHASRYDCPHCGAATEEQVAVQCPTCDLRWPEFRFRAPRPAVAAPRKKMSTK